MGWWFRESLFFRSSRRARPLSLSRSPLTPSFFLHDTRPCTSPSSLSVARTINVVRPAFHLLSSFLARRVSSVLLLVSDSFLPSFLGSECRNSSRPDQRHLRQGRSYSRIEVDVDSEGWEGEGRGGEEEAVETCERRKRFSS